MARLLLKVSITSLSSQSCLPVTVSGLNEAGPGQPAQGSISPRSIPPPLLARAPGTYGQAAEGELHRLGQSFMSPLCGQTLKRLDPASLLRAQSLRAAFLSPCWHAL